MFKRFITSLFCLFLIFVSIPFIGDTSFLCSSVYADSDLPTGYTPANSDTDLASSFNDYVKSRNANFSGSLPDAANLYILNLMNKGAQNLNVNLDTIKSKIAKKSDTGGKIIWYFDSTVTNFYNSLFDFLLQDLDLSVGDTANKQLYSGEYFVDDNGNSCLVTVINTSVSSSQTIQPGNLVARGSNFIKPGGENAVHWYDSNGNSTYLSFNYQNRTYNMPIKLVNLYSQYKYTCDTTTSNPSEWTCYRYINANGTPSDGYPVIFKGTSNYYGYGILRDNNWGYVLGTFYNNVQDSVVIIFQTIDNKTINNNNYEGDTYITNEGDVVNNITPGGNDPGWNVGGGQGSYNDGQGNNYTINFPDFELPDLNIDWSIQGLGNKFPFSIPFDIASLVSVLNADPEAPRFQGTLDLGVTTYDYDINLSQFDTVASACRIAELLLLVFGLIMITRSIIKG